MESYTLMTSFDPVVSLRCRSMLTAYLLEPSGCETG
jgi:hypothetical protein